MGFNLNKFKVLLKLAINRSKLLHAKKTSLQQHQRKEIADLLSAGKIESARIRVGPSTVMQQWSHRTLRLLLLLLGGAHYSRRL